MQGKVQSLYHYMSFRAMLKLGHMSFLISHCELGGRSAHIHLSLVNQVQTVPLYKTTAVSKQSVNKYLKHVTFLVVFVVHGKLILPECNVIDCNAS